MSKERTLPIDPSAWQIAEANRRTNLYILALGACAMGLLLGLTAPGGGPSFNLLGQLPGWPMAYGMALLVLGGAQILGLSRDWRILALVACGGASLWYVCFGGAFVITWFHWVVVEDMHGDRPSVYPVAPYLMVGALHLASAETIWHYYRSARTPRHPEGQVPPHAHHPA